MRSERQGENVTSPPAEQEPAIPGLLREILDVARYNPDDAPLTQLSRYTHGDARAVGRYIDRLSKPATARGEEPSVEQWRAFNETTGAVGYMTKLGPTGANSHPDRCVCQGDDRIPHKHYTDDPLHPCARCGKCAAYQAAIPRASSEPAKEPGERERELEAAVKLSEQREKEARRTAEEWRNEANDNADAIERVRQEREAMRRNRNEFSVENARLRAELAAANQHVKILSESRDEASATVERLTAELAEAKRKSSDYVAWALNTARQHGWKGDSAFGAFDHLDSTLEEWARLRSELGDALCSIHDNLNCIEFGTNYSDKGLAWCREEIRKVMDSLRPARPQPEKPSGLLKVVLCRKCAGDPQHVVIDVTATSEPCSLCGTTDGVWEWLRTRGKPRRNVPDAKHFCIYEKCSERVSEENQFCQFHCDNEGEHPNRRQPADPPGHTDGTHGSIPKIGATDKITTGQDGSQKDRDARNVATNLAGRSVGRLTREEIPSICPPCSPDCECGAYRHVVCLPLAGTVRTIDACIHKFVAALNAGGVETVASCCGHGKRQGVITLEDGRELVIRPYDERNHTNNEAGLRAGEGGK
jgi:hypothetical protein